MRFYSISSAEGITWNFQHTLLSLTMNVGGSWTIDVEVMKRPPKNAVSEAWGQSKTLDFLFFVNRDVDGVRLKYCVNFYENQASETSKIKIRGFFYFTCLRFLSGLLILKVCKKKLDQNRSVSRASFVRKKGRISRVPLG